MPLFPKIDPQLARYRLAFLIVSFFAALMVLLSAHLYLMLEEAESRTDDCGLGTYPVHQNPMVDGDEH
jgi:hypothetical protein